MEGEIRSFQMFMWKSGSFKDFLGPIMLISFSICSSNAICLQWYLSNFRYSYISPWKEKDLYYYATGFQPPA